MTIDQAVQAFKAATKAHAQAVEASRAAQKAYEEARAASLLAGTAMDDAKRQVDNAIAAFVREG